MQKSFFFSVYWLPRGLLAYGSRTLSQGNKEAHWDGMDILGVWRVAGILCWFWDELLSSCACALSWDPMDYVLPGFSVSGIFQARILELVAISHSRGSSLPRDRTQVSCVSCIWQADSLPLASTLGNSEGQGRLMGCILWNCRESDVA